VTFAAEPIPAFTRDCLFQQILAQWDANT